LPVNQPKRNSPVASSNANSAAEQRRKRKRKENGAGQNQGQGQRPQGNHQPGTPGQQVPQQGGAPQQGGNRPEFRKPTGPGPSRPDFRNKGQQPVSNGGTKEEPSEKEIQDQIKATLARLSGAGKSGKFAQRAKFRRQKRD